MRAYTRESCVQALTHVVSYTTYKYIIDFICEVRTSHMKSIMYLYVVKEIPLLLTPVGTHASHQNIHYISLVIVLL